VTGLEAATQEEWRPAVGYDGRYEVSNLGRIRSTRGLFGSRTLNGSTKGNRYWRVTLTKDGRQRTPAIHTLVLTAFAGPRPPGMQGCHDDDNPANNRLTNLYWGTSSQNNRDKVRNGGHDPRRGESSNFAKLTASQVLEIRARYTAGGISQRALAREYGISRSAVGLILLRKTWAHITDENQVAA
jgi:hypothetical protein